MRKKEFLTAILCVVLTIGIIGIVMKSGSKQHPDLLHEAEAKTADIDVATEYIHVHPMRLYIGQEKQLYTIDTEEEQIETLELDDLEEELDVADESVEEDVVEVVSDEAQEHQAERTTTRETGGSASQGGGQRTPVNDSIEETGTPDPPPKENTDPSDPEEGELGDDDPNPPVIPPAEPDDDPLNGNIGKGDDGNDEMVDDPADSEVPDDDEPE